MRFFGARPCSGLTVYNGSCRKNRPCQDDCYGKNSLNIVDSGARYKVYEPIHTSDRLTSHRWLTRVTRNSFDRCRPIKNFWARARIGLWRGVQDHFSTVSTTVHHTRNAVAREKSRTMLQHGHRSRSLCNRIYYGAETAVPFTLARLLGLASDLDGDGKGASARA